MFLKILQNSQESIFAGVSFLLLRPATYFKKRPWHSCFPLNFAKFLRTPFFTKHLWTTASANNTFLAAIRYCLAFQTQALLSQSWQLYSFLFPFPYGIYSFIVNTRAMCKICSKWTIKTPEQSQWCKKQTNFTQVDLKGDLFRPKRNIKYPKDIKLLNLFFTLLSWTTILD